jgi:hypothetical protein
MNTPAEFAIRIFEHSVSKLDKKAFFTVITRGNIELIHRVSKPATLCMSTRITSSDAVAHLSLVSLLWKSLYCFRDHWFMYQSWDIFIFLSRVNINLGICFLPSIALENKRTVLDFRSSLNLNLGLLNLGLLNLGLLNLGLDDITPVVLKKALTYKEGKTSFIEMNKFTTDFNVDVFIGGNLFNSITLLEPTGFNSQFVKVMQKFTRFTFGAWFTTKLEVTAHPVNLGFSKGSSTDYNLWFFYSNFYLFDDLITDDFRESLVKGLLPWFITRFEDGKDVNVIIFIINLSRLSVCYLHETALTLSTGDFEVEES